jgi:hypothetical protein
MHVEIRVGNKGFMDRPFMELAPGESHTFVDLGEDLESEDFKDARILHVQCNEDAPWGTLLILPGDDDSALEMLGADIPAEILNKTTVHVINGEPETVTINNPGRGLKSAQAILKYVNEA